MTIYDGAGLCLDEGLPQVSRKWTPGQLVSVVLSRKTSQAGDFFFFSISLILDLS